MASGSLVDIQSLAVPKSRLEVPWEATTVAGCLARLDVAAALGLLQARYRRQSPLQHEDLLCCLCLLDLEDTRQAKVLLKVLLAARRIAGCSMGSRMSLASPHSE